MATVKGRTLGDNNPLTVGGIEIMSTEDLAKLCAEGGDPTARGIVLINEKVNGAILPDPIHAGKFYKVTASVYVSRDSINDDEQAAMDKLAAGQKTRKDDKEQADQRNRERENTAIQRTATETAVGIAKTLLAPR